ncbi:MAG: hypothetical protein V4727_10240 [Verrucomicrobiota bacterium]
MKTTLIFLFLTSFCFAAQDSAIVRFANGDKLSGNAIALNMDTLTWESELLKDQARFKLNQILDLQLPSKMDNKSAEEAGHEAILELTNGDSVKGLLVGLNDNEIRIKTWYAGELVFRRLNVKSIAISKNSRVLYRGPLGMDGWTLSGEEGTWTFENNELLSKSTGSIGREINFTDEVKISYDVSGKAMMRTKLIFFATDIKTATPNTGYEVLFQGSMIRIRRLSDNNWLDTKRISRQFQANEKSNIAIQISRKSRKIMILIDDQLQGIWEEDALETSTGKGLQFLAEGTTEMAVSNILVTEWDGFVDESLAEELEVLDPRVRMLNMQMNRGGMQMETPPEPAELPEGRMMLSNGDTLEGEVLGIEGEMIKIKTPFAEVVFPVHRINNIALKKANLETPKLYNGDVRAVLADGSKFVFRLDDVKDGKLIGFSQNFGRAEFVQSAFKRIEFNIYPKPKAN